MVTDLPPDQPVSTETDRRNDERVVARVDVRFQEPSEAVRAFRAYSLNFSVGGLCLKTRRRYEVGSKLQLALTVDGQEYKLTGVVAWERGGAIGVRFQDVNADDRKRLSDLVTRFKAP